MVTTNIDIALNELYLRQITAREHLLTEVVRVKMTAMEVSKNPRLYQDKEKLFQFMKKHTEQELGFFPADREDFWEIYSAIVDLDIVEIALGIYHNDRLGTVISPKYLTQYIKDNLSGKKLSKILITEAEKHLSGLKEILSALKDVSITLTTQNSLMHKFLSIAFRELSNVEIIFESIYSNCLVGKEFDYIYAMPSFGNKVEELQGDFMTNESDGIAIEVLLPHLRAGGMIDIILPAKITFAAHGYDRLRDYIKENYSLKSIYILPEGTFRPTTAIKTYLFSISNETIESIGVGSLELSANKLKAKMVKDIPKGEFMSQPDWRIELLLSDDDINIKQFKASSLTKIKLKEVAEIFRGKSILKNDSTLGNISILNISNIDNGEIDYSKMDTIEEEERKIKRYELEDGDVVLSCRGTAIKSAVFKAQTNIIIASANLIVIRPKGKISGDYIKIFFESPIGQALIKSFQRGTSVMNINHSDIMEMEIPVLDMEDQLELVRLYNEELQIYKDKVSSATNRWNSTKANIYSKLT